MPPARDFDSSLEKGFRGMFLNDKKLFARITKYHHTGDKKVLDQSDESDADVEQPAPSEQAMNVDEKPSSSKHDKSAAGLARDDTPSPNLPDNWPPNDEDTKKRFVFRGWPRDPNGKVIKHSANFTGGKVAGKGGATLWGATLYDFYRVSLLPQWPNYVRITTSSRMLEWAKESGETEFAKDEIAWAEQEPQPRKREPCDVLELAKDMDVRVRLGAYRQASMAKDEAEDESKNDGAGAATSGSDDPFHPSQYPKPWPLAPFAYFAPLLQERLPYFMLPEKLVVHDPCGVLAARGGIPLNKPWSKDTKYTPHNYALSLSPETKTLVEKQRQEAREKWAKSHEDKGLCFMWNDVLAMKKTGPVDMPLYVPMPPPPPPPFSLPVAHLYFSTDELKGRGNHSVVYNVEWELPRAVFEDCDQKRCKECIMEAVAEVLQAEREAEKTANPDQTPAHPTMSKKKGTMNITEHVVPGVAFDIVHEDELKNESDAKEHTPTNDPRRQYTVSEPQLRRLATYDGPVRKIEIPESRWSTIHDPSHTCSHKASQEKLKPHPATFKVRVTAKLSLQRDEHLAREAHNYQNFEDVLFEHYTGYNIVPPLHDPTPVGAVVPQFYGYYEAVDEKGEKIEVDERGRGYLSPILLLEDCGEPIVVNELSIDDRQECAALLYRLHHAGWTHNSFFQRNILMQHGDIADWPITRMIKPERRFRLIDFGRAVNAKVKGKDGEVVWKNEFRVQRANEEMLGQRELNIGL